MFPISPIERRTTMPYGYRNFPLLLAAFAAAACLSTPALAQSDRPVTTTREKPAPAVPDQVLEEIQVSPQPRYYLDTIDNLTRRADDLTRTAPGLTKNNYVGRVYEVHQTNAIEIQSYLLRTLAYEGGVCEVMGLDSAKDEEGKSVQYLFVTAPDFMIPGIDEIVETCDRPGFKFYDATGADYGSGPGAIHYIGKHRTASELVAILSGTELGNVGAFLFPPFADDSTNSIYVVENPTDIADDLAALAMFDKPPLQVDLEVIIYEINERNLSKLGLDWDAWKRFITGSLDYSSVGSSSFWFDHNIDSFDTLISLDARVLADFLNYTAQTGTARVDTTARLTMVNSEDNPGGLSGGVRGTSTGIPAVVESIVEFPYTAIAEDVGPTNSTNSRNDATRFSGIRVEILPFIATESITLQVGAVVNSVVGYTKNADIPLISSSHASSVVNLKDGSPLVLSGLKKSEQIRSRVGIPGLKDLPVVRYLFSKEITNTSESQILVVLKPRLKSNEGDPDALQGPAMASSDPL